MNQIVISNEQFQQALLWINGEESPMPESEVRTMIRSMVDGFRRSYRKHNPDGPVPRFKPLTPHPLSLRGLFGEDIDLMLPQSSATPSVTVKEESLDEVDSVMLLDSIGHVCVKAGYPVSLSKAQVILYCIYGCNLAFGKERLPIEHPQMWKYGPVFPSAYRKSHLDDPQKCAEAYEKLMKKAPLTGSLLTAKAHAMMGTPMADLNGLHKGPFSPYGRLLKENPGKWGMEIPDEKIAVFFFRSRC